jgi:hypothetical protein
MVQGFGFSMNIHGFTEDLHAGVSTVVFPLPLIGSPHRRGGDPRAAAVALGRIPPSNSGGGTGRTAANSPLGMSPAPSPPRPAAGSPMTRPRHDRRSV